MKSARLETLVWVCIYGGLAIAMLGLWSSGGDGVLGHALAVGGGLLVLVGVLLIWLRSRLPDAEAKHEGGER